MLKYLFLLVLVFVMFSTGCATTAMNSGYLGRKALPENIQKEFACQKFTGEYLMELVEECASYKLWQVKFKSCHNIVSPHMIIMDYYEVKCEEKKSIVLVLPILGGSNYFANSFARYFVEHGLSALIVHRQKKYKNFKKLEKINKNLKQIVFDHKQALNWIETRNEIDASRIGVFGISMGSIKATLISALDNRIKASVMCLVGGNLPEILTTSDERGVVERREEIKKLYGLSDDELRLRLKRQITCDPINYADYIDAENTLMVLGYFDSTVPYKNGMELWKKIGQPEKITLLAGHYTAILSLPYIKYKSFKFLNEKLWR